MEEGEREILLKNRSESDEPKSMEDGGDGEILLKNRSKSDEPKSMEEGGGREILLKNRSKSFLEGAAESKSFFTWVFLDQSSLWRAGMSWSIFSLLAIGVPVLSHVVFSCSDCDRKHRRPFDAIVQSSLSVFATLSFACLSRFTSKYGLRKFLFLDKLCDVSEKVREGYTEQLHSSIKILSAFVFPCFLADTAYKIWWFTSGRTQIPYFQNLCLSDIAACILLQCSWLYRTTIFFLVCVIFRLICHLQILRLEDFAQVFVKEYDVGSILLEHLTIRRNFRVISHRFRVFILMTLVLVTVSQFASLLVITKSSSSPNVNIFTAGEIALCSITLVTGLFLCLRSAAKITHRAQSLTSLAAKWHVCATIGSFDDLDNETPTSQIVSLPIFPSNDAGSGSDNEEGDGDNALDDTNMVPIHAHSISYQKRQALVNYFEHNRAGITVYGFMLDRTSLHTILLVQFSLTLWILNKTIGIS